MQKAPSVSVLINSIKNCLENQFKFIEVIGEITNFSKSGSGHFYFNLSDSEASLNCALFRLDALRNSQVRRLKDGDKVVASGPIGVYSKRGSFQLIVKRIIPVGKGDFKEKFEILKKKLAAEGLFDLDRKQKIPKFPKRIGVITAEGGAALQDFLNVTRRRTMQMDILLSSALVQGEEAPQSLRDALFRLIKYHREAPEEKKLDVIVLTRGGGSSEDLWAFNDEALAWDLFNCPIPTISAVGHEVDFSISDMVADQRCETPSAAAEVLSSGQTHLREIFSRLEQGLRRTGREVLYRLQERLDQNHPRLILNIIKERWNHLERRLERANVNERLMEFTGYHEKTLRLEDLSHRLLQTLPRKSSELLAQLKKNNEMLRILNPESVLGRGYSYLQDSQKNVVTSKEIFEGLCGGTILSVKFHDGTGHVQKTEIAKS